MKRISLLAARPDLSNQIHPHKNQGIAINEIGCRSNLELWWLCEHGHEWKEKISNRARQKKADCKVCRSLATTHPQIARELHPTLNGLLRAEDLTYGSPQKIFWICPIGHIYSSTVKNRAVNGSGCPDCSGRNVSKTDALSETHPHVAKLLHPEKNVDLSPDRISAHYRQEVWWRCEHGHEWRDTVQNSCRRAQPICRGCRSVAYLKPDLLNEWHPENQASPHETTANSNRIVKWSCSTCGHEWAGSVANRYRGSGCPGCSGATPTHATSLAILYPDIAREWDIQCNSRSPHDYTPGSEEEVSWICPNAHRYRATIYDRAKRSRGCPVCRSVAFRCPHLLDEWATSNTLSPYEEWAGSAARVEWTCKVCGWKWSAKIVDRLHGSGCPECNSGWTIESIRRFVKSLIPYLDSFTPAALYILLQQTGLLRLSNDSKGRAFVQALKTGRFPKEELEKFAREEPSLVDEFITDPQKSLASFAAGVDDRLVANLTEDQIGSGDDLLPLVETKDVLTLLTSTIFSSLDREAMDFFVKEAVARIWHHAFADESTALEQLKAYSGDGLYAQEVRDLFLREYREARALEVPDGYAFPYQPNLMQRHVAALVKSRKRLGNWSGTGAGKTLSAILASRVIGADLTVICCPNSVVDNWERNIREAYPDSLIVAKRLDLHRLQGSRNKYLILNYEFFQQPAAQTRLKALLEVLVVNFVIIDEIHYSKQREAERLSERKKVITAFLSEAAAQNADLHVLGMSATPIINNLYEGKALIELVTGLHHDDLQTKATLSNCVSHYQKFISCGIRCIPNYACKFSLITEEVNCSDLLPDIMKLRPTGSVADLEGILTTAKIPCILSHIRPRTIIYTHYLKGILSPLQDAIEQAGWKVAVFTGDAKDGLSSFKSGEADVLIASSCASTGVDGLQHSCNRLIINSLPWTHAEYQQLIGRLYRQGQRQDTVEVIVPLTMAEVNDARWSWCESRWKRIQYKKSIADAAVDGVIPDGHLRTPAQAYKDIMSWLERLERGELHDVEREPISLRLDVAIKPAALRRFGDLPRMNHRINHEHSDDTHRRFLKDPSEWVHYHKVYRENRKDWPVIPCEEAIRWCKERPHMIIGDFGCGEALLAANLENTVYSFDHVAINDSVMACNMTHVPLDEATLDAAIFSLSLMGLDWLDYLREANRCLKLDGYLWIAEPASRIKDMEQFRKALFRLGFDVLDPIEKKGEFAFVRALKSKRDPNLHALESLHPESILG